MDALKIAKQCLKLGGIGVHLNVFGCGTVQEPSRERELAYKDGITSGGLLAL